MKPFKEYVKAYLCICGCVLLFNFISGLIIGEDIINGKIFQMVMPAILVIVMEFLDKQKPKKKEIPV